MEVQKRSPYLALCICLSFALERTKVVNISPGKHGCPKPSCGRDGGLCFWTLEHLNPFLALVNIVVGQGEIYLFLCLKFSIILIKKIIAGIDTSLVIMYLAHFSCDVDEQVCKEMCAKDCRPTSVPGVYFSMKSGLTFLSEICPLTAVSNLQPWHVNDIGFEEDTFHFFSRKH